MPGQMLIDSPQHGETWIAGLQTSDCGIQFALVRKQVHELGVEPHIEAVRAQLCERPGSGSCDVVGQETAQVVSQSSMLM
jgi:hypothetical protein